LDVLPKAVFAFTALRCDLSQFILPACIWLICGLRLRDFHNYARLDVDLAPEARPTIAHGETVGKKRDGFKPQEGRKKISIIARFCRPCRGLARFDETTHGCRRGLLSSAPPALKIAPQKTDEKARLIEIKKLLLAI